MRAYYFATEKRKLRYRDNRPIVVGETHTVDITESPLEFCNWGLHASERALDALKYAPGSILYIVKLSGEILTDDDKLCAEKRTYLAELDAAELLREFARKQALINIVKIKPYCNDDEEYNTIVNYLITGNTQLRSAAESAAESAARSAKSAAQPAAWAAAWPAESAAEWAAESAAWAAAWAAAEAAEAARAAAESIWSAARSAAESAWSAAQPAAWSAALSAALSESNKLLESMIEESLKEKYNEIY